VKPEYIVYVLTFLSAVVVALTRVRLSQARAAGHAQVGMGTVNAHTGFGVPALVLWVIFLVTGHDNSLIGVLGLFFYWLTTVVGLLILSRWKPSRGRHASDSTDDNWSEGPGLSILAHVGMLVGVLVFTWFFATHN
jgi:phosphatidylserine synthase